VSLLSIHRDGTVVTCANIFLISPAAFRPSSTLTFEVLECEATVLRHGRPDCNFLFGFKLFIRGRSQFVRAVIKNSATGAVLTRRGVLTLRTQVVREQKKVQARIGDISWKMELRKKERP